MAKKIYTIGYAGFPDTEDFIAALKQYGVQILIDVRSSPFSAYHESYNKDRLAPLLKKNDIYYANYAVQFGARQENTAFYKDGRLDFETFSKSEQFIEGAKNIEKSGAVICLMCAEKHPEECHRTILVSRALRDRGNTVEHIVPVESGNGESEKPLSPFPNTATLSQDDIDKLLLDEYFPDRNQFSLFSDDNMTDEEYIAEAYRLRNDKIGFRQEDLKRI